MPTNLRRVLADMPEPVVDAVMATVRSKAPGASQEAPQQRPAGEGTATLKNFRVIRNPNRLLQKFEVWYSGPAEGVDQHGYRCIQQVCKPIRAFLTESQAKAYIEYEMSVFDFKGE